MEGGPGWDIVVNGYTWSQSDKWDFSDFGDLTSFQEYVLNMEGLMQAGTGTFTAQTAYNKEYMDTVADGVEGLDIIVKGIVQTLKTIPGVPAHEIRRFELLDETLEKGVKLIKVGAMDDTSAKKFVKDGMELAFGELSDAALAIAVGYLANHVTQLLPGWGKAVPFAAIIATYAASKATGDVGEVIADAVTEALFAGIDVVKQFNYFFQSGVTEVPENLSTLSDDLVLRQNDMPYDSRGFTPAGYSNGEYFEYGQLWFWELGDSGNPALGRLNADLDYYTI